MFSSKRDMEFINHINKLENKIDILINTKNGCNCEQRESKIYKDLQDFFETKFETMKVNILNNIPKENSDNLLQQIIQIINDTHDKNKHELISILSDICKKSECPHLIQTSVTEIQLRENISGLFASLVNNYSKFDERLRCKIDELSSNVKDNDITLRTGLQDIIISVKNDIISSISNNNLDDFIKNMTTQVNSINDRVDGFYFENEIIKHQLSLQEEIRKYNDDIDQLKLLITNVKTTIENTLHLNDFEHLQTKYNPKTI